MVAGVWRLDKGLAKRSLAETEFHSAAAVFELEGNEPCQKGGRKDLAKNCFEAAQASRDRVHWHNVAIAQRRQRREAEEDQIAGKFLPAGGVYSGYRARHKQTSHAI
jgi:hypothetical protein